LADPSFQLNAANAHGKWLAALVGSSEFGGWE